MWEKKTQEGSLQRIERENKDAGFRKLSLNETEKGI